jgi:hypothetical protein
MTAYNVVRFRVKPGREKEFVDHHRVFHASNLPGFRKASLIKTGERSYCLIGQWGTMDDIVRARPQMIASLDEIRGLLEDLGGGLGVTDPVSGEAVLELT